MYLDPEEFFRKTYLTTGLSSVLRRVAGALSGGGESGDRIISLQTARKRTAYQDVQKLLFQAD